MRRALLTGAAVLATLATLPLAAAGGYYVWDRMQAPTTADVKHLERDIKPALVKDLNTDETAKIEVRSVDCLQPVGAPGEATCIADTVSSGYDNGGYARERAPSRSP